ncbi:MAG: Major Facilitator Superfamily protein [Candidatus Lokiarchaeum sp. GC14_75]|nr:MAG: Major Facilitator Superfamily protein [Candidatus Lokiarchaeum sp. GC14_75]
MGLFKIDESRFTHDYNQMLKIIILNSLGFFFIGFWIPIVARFNMGASTLQIGLVVTSFVIGRMISGFVTGFVTDRVKSRTKLVLIGSFGRAGSYFITYFAFVTNQIFLLGVGHSILGLMSGVFWIPFNTFVAEKSSKKHRSQAYGKRDSTNAVGQIIGAVLGFTLLGVASSFTDNLFLIYIVIPIYGFSNILAGVIFYRKVDESIKFAEIGTEKTDEVTKNTKFFISRSMVIGAFFLICILFLGSINGSIARPFLSIYIMENIESDINLVVLAYLPAGLLATLLAPKLGALVDKLPPLVGISITSTLGALMTWLLINSANIWVFSLLLLGDLAIGMAAGLIFQNLLSRISTENRGKIFGVGDFFAFLGSVIGPLLGGIAWDLISPQFPFIISIFVELSLIPLYLAAVYLLLPHMAESYESKKNKLI